MKLLQKHWAAILSFLIPLAIYSLTLCRVIAPFQLGDAGELGTAVYVLGIPHPPGYPFYTILCAFFGIFFHFSSPILIYNFLSAVFGALTIWLVFLILQNYGSQIIALGAALILAFIPVFWSQALIAEVYTVYTFFLALLLYLLLQPPTKNKTRLPYLLAFLYGMSLSHHLIMVILLPSLILWALRYYSKTIFNGKTLVNLVTLSLLTFLLYSILTIRAQASPPSRWPRPENFLQLVDHVTSRTYKSMFFSSTTDKTAFLNRLDFMAKFLAHQINPLFYLLSFWGLGLIFKKERVLFYFLSLLISCDLLYSLFINVGDILAVGLASLICLIIAFTVAMDYLVASWLKKLSWAGIIVFLFPLILLSQNYRQLDLSRAKNAFKIEEYTKAFYHLELGEKFLRSGAKIQAYENFDLASQTGYYLDWLQRKIATYNFEQKRYPQALLNYQRLIKLNPDNAYYYAQLAYMSELLDEWPQAALNYQRAIKLAPEAMENYLNLALVYERQKDYNNQLQIMSQALERAPQHQEVKLQYSRALENQRR